MYKRSNSVLYIGILLTLLILGNWKFIVKTVINRDAVTVNEEEQIKQAVTSLIEKRYVSLSKLNLEDFSNLVRTSKQGKDFLASESEKIGIEIHHAKAYKLKYVQYKYYLDFQSITVDSTTGIANVTVLEGHDVVFEISNPVTSSMRNLKHIITLEKENGYWKILSDNYDDYLWKVIRKPGNTKEKILSMVDQSAKPIDNNYASNSISIVQSLPTNTYPYYRKGAVDYAVRWAYSRNPNYTDFVSMGGDCTNFVSQAMYEGGKAMMEYAKRRPSVGDPGWYYVNINDRGIAWPDVGALKSFLVDEPTAKAGPIGKLLDHDQLSVLEGDIVQYELNGDTVWDHTAIIVGFQDPEQFHTPLIASHDPNINNYPYTTLNYKDYRFITVLGNRGYRLLLSRIDFSSSVPRPNPYPASLNYENSLQIGYPGPMDYNALSKSQPYPAP